MIFPQHLSLKRSWTKIGAHDISSDGAAKFSCYASLRLSSTSSRFTRTGS